MCAETPSLLGAQVLAIKVLLDHVEDMDRAHEYATKVDESEVWSELAHVELDRSMVSQAIASYLRAGDASRRGVTSVAWQAEHCCFCTGRRAQGL